MTAPAKYRWTPELLEELRRAYASPSRKDLIAGISRLAAKTGDSRKSIGQRAKRLGLWWTRTPRWTEDQVRYLEDRLGEMPLKAIAKRLRKSPEAVRHKAAELRLPTRFRNGYTIAEARQILGASWPRMRAWIDRGLFGHVWRDKAGKCERIRDSALVAFIHRHYEEYDLHRVDQTWFKHALFSPYAAPAPEGEEASE